MSDHVEHIMDVLVAEQGERENEEDRDFVVGEEVTDDNGAAYALQRALRLRIERKVMHERIKLG